MKRFGATGIVRACLLGVVGLGLVLPPSHAVVILDSTWRQEGGGPGREAAGFGAHIRLAAEPQFRSVVAFSYDGATWGDASGTWIGNHQGHAYLLTAAHVFELPVDTGEYVVRGPGGRGLSIDRIWLHPEWNGDIDMRSAFDVASVRLSAPLNDLGPQPILYTGRGERGGLLTFIGYGARGIGSTGEQERYMRGSDAAAAQGVVDDWEDLILPPPRHDDAGNYLGVFFPREDGSLVNELGGASRPATPLVGLLGSGDSGGSAWMQFNGDWVIVAVNSSGSGDGNYGEISWFTRVAPFQSWIRSIVPNARFFGDGSAGGGRQDHAPVPAPATPPPPVTAEPPRKGAPLPDNGKQQVQENKTLQPSLQK